MGIDVHVGAQHRTGLYSVTVTSYIMRVNVESQYLKLGR